MDIFSETFLNRISISKPKKETFTSTIRLFEYEYDVRTVFDDFLTMSICAMGQKPGVIKSFDEDLYLGTAAKYKDGKLVTKFPEMFALVVTEMGDRWDSGEGFEVLGDFYERNLSSKRKSQFFTPWRILDPAYGSGWMLMAAMKYNG